MRRFWWYFLVAFAALTSGLWFAQARYAPKAAEAPALASMWRLSFPDLDGAPQPLSRWQGQILVLNFWASWCAPCREEMPDFASLRAEHHEKGVEFVGIAVDNAPNVRAFIAKHPVNYPILIGEGAAQTLARQLGDTSGALPYTIVIDRDGQMVLNHLGRLSRESLEATLSKLGA